MSSCEFLCYEFIYLVLCEVLNFINKGKLFKVRDASIWLMFLNVTIINK